MIAMLVFGFELSAKATGQEDWQTISNRWAPVSVDAIQESAKKGDVSAQYYLAIEYIDGDRGIAKDPAEAFTWMELAAQQGMARAQRKLGFMYENGFGVLPDYAKAAKFISEAAEQGDAMAQNNLGWLYSQGQGVPENIHEALKWYQKSADQGEALAEENLAWMYAQGVYGPLPNTNGQGARAQILCGGIGPDHELAEKWMRKAVDLNSSEGQCKLGDLLISEVTSNGFQDATSFPAAGEWYAKAAEQGNAKAEFKLAEMYNFGQLGDDQRSNCIPCILKQPHRETRKLRRKSVSCHNIIQTVICSSRLITFKHFCRVRKTAIWRRNTNWPGDIRQVSEFPKMKKKLLSGCKKQQNNRLIVPSLVTHDIIWE